MNISLYQGCIKPTSILHMHILYQDDKQYRFKIVLSYNYWPIATSHLFNVMLYFSFSVKKTLIYPKYVSTVNLVVLKSQYINFTFFYFLDFGAKVEAPDKKAIYFYYFHEIKENGESTGFRFQYFKEKREALRGPSSIAVPSFK